LPTIRTRLVQLGQELAKDQQSLTEQTRAQRWAQLENYINRLRAAADELFLMQTKVRVNLIQLEPIPFQLDEAIAYARANRLDLMNQRAQAVDAWRKIEVSASALKAGLALQAAAHVATKPDSTNPVDFRASASQYTIGFTFDGPLNRLAERNQYKASLIGYQQARRNFMALDDAIQVAIRQDIRQLETERANFRIAQQSLISAARGVEQASFQLQNPPPREKEDTAATINVLTALSSLLTAKSNLISSWVNYETGRTRLLLDMDALQLDERGLPNNEHDNGTDPNPGSIRNQPAERLPPATPEREDGGS
jgi:hypothetical protein